MPPHGMMALQQPVGQSSFYTALLCNDEKIYLLIILDYSYILQSSSPATQFVLWPD
jgi:hypothetical protein